METFVIAGESALREFEVAREVNSYRLDPRGSSPVAHYAYALLALVEGMDQEAESHVPQVMRLKKDAWLSSIGRTIESIAERNQEGFDTALAGLLEAHKRMAKFGSIRESPEGFISLAAMSLSKQALDRGMTVETPSEYLSLAFLQYLATLAWNQTDECPSP